MAIPRVYFDICALKRGWDDLSQIRIRLEAEAMHGLLSLADSNVLVVMHSVIHDEENARNPDRDRRGAIEELLATLPLEPLDMNELKSRSQTLQSKCNMHTFDALHFAAATLGEANWFVTTDDRLVRQIARSGFSLRARTPIQLLGVFVP